MFYKKRKCTLKKTWRDVNPLSSKLICKQWPLPGAVWPYCNATLLQANWWIMGHVIDGPWTIQSMNSWLAYDVFFGLSVFPENGSLWKENAEYQNIWIVYAWLNFIIWFQNLPEKT